MRILSLLLGCAMLLLPLCAEAQNCHVAAKVDAGLQDRGCDYLPMPSYPAGNKCGTIVVRVIVNPEGKVVLAEPTAVGSTIYDTELRAAAKKTALKARFKKIDGLGDQGGTITYVFKLK